MKKQLLAAALAVALPMTASAAPLALANHQYDMTGYLKLKAQGICYGTLKFKANGKTDPVLFPMSATILVGPNDQTGGTVSWINDTLLPGQPALVGGILVRSKNKMTMEFAPQDKGLLATALLTYADAYPDLEAHATPDAYTMTLSFKGETVKAKDIAITTSYDGPCQGAAQVTRLYKGTHVSP